MALTVNTNIASLSAQRNLSGSQNMLSTSLERLSTGLRINSAKDDAAGLAISERFTAQVRGLNQGVRNANDGISLAQTAEGALKEVTNNLQRIRELAVQASNATNSQNDRNALQTEVSQLLAEIDRVADKTDFNGTTLLDGTFSGAVFQVGANATDTITVASISDTNTSELGEVNKNASFTSAAGLAATLAGQFSSFATAVTAGTIDVAGTDIGALAATTSATLRAGDFVAAVNAVSSTTGVTASIESGSVRLSSETSFSIGGATLGTVGYTAALFSSFSSQSGIDTLTVAGYSSAQTAITLVDSALQTVNTSRANLGSIQSRFESVVANQATTSENLSASRSRIVDADFASETANLAKAQILQQSGIAMLAQANSVPQNVLALLQ